MLPEGIMTNGKLMACRFLLWFVLITFKYLVNLIMYLEVNGSSKLLSNKKDSKFVLCLDRRKATFPKEASLMNNIRKKEK